VSKTRPWQDPVHPINSEVAFTPAMPLKNDYNRSCMHNILSEINNCPGNKSLIVSLTNPADLQTGKRGKGDSIWLEVRNRG